MPIPLERCPQQSQMESPAFARQTLTGERLPARAGQRFTAIPAVVGKPTCTRPTARGVVLGGGVSLVGTFSPFAFSNVAKMNII